MASNPFIGLTSAELATLRADYLAALSALAKNQSYSLAGKSLSRANLADVRETLGQILTAIDLANDDSASETFVNFTG